MSLIWQVIISILLAFLLICIISIIDFNRWYRKDKEIKNSKGIISYKRFKEVLGQRRRLLEELQLQQEQSGKIYQTELNNLPYLLLRKEK